MDAIHLERGQIRADNAIVEPKGYSSFHESKQHLGLLWNFHFLTCSSILFFQAKLVIIEDRVLLTSG